MVVYVPRTFVFFSISLPFSPTDSLSLYFSSKDQAIEAIFVSREFPQSYRAVNVSRSLDLKPLSSRAL